MSKIKEILIYHHSHLDVGYTHPQPVLMELQNMYIDQALELCEATEALPEASRFYWTCEATAPVLRWLKQADERQLERFERYARNGQLAVSAMFAHTAPLTNAEQLARMLYPIRELRERFGLKLNTAINHDINGQPWTLSQVLLDAGVELYLTGINIHFGGYPLQRPRAFRWKAPDGRSLLCFNGEHYSLFTQFCKLWEKSTARMREGLDEYFERLERQDYPYDFIFLSATNVPLLDNTPPDTELLEMIERWNAEEHPQKMRLVTPETFRERLLELPEELVPTFAGDWTDYWNFGAGSSAYETRLNRRSKISLRTAEYLAALSHGPDRTDRRWLDEAWEQVNLYDEHTWGANISITDPDDHYTKALWAHKAHYAYQGNSMASLALNRKLEQFAGNPPQSEQPEGLLLVNPTPAEQTIDLHIPLHYKPEGRQTAAARYIYHQNNYDADRSLPYAGTRTLPPFGYQFVPFAELSEPPRTADVIVESGRIETSFYDLRYDPATGRITALTDKKLDWQMIDPTSEWTLFQYVHEKPDPLRNPQHRTSLYHRDVDKTNANISCWKREWKARRRGADKLASLRVERRGSAVELALAWEGEGFDRLEQRIALFADRPGIELTATMRKTDVREPEAMYFAFPLNLDAGWQAIFDSASTFVKLDEEQLPGMCRDWATVDQTVSVFDGARGVTLACPDAPLVQIGDFHFGKEQTEVPRDANPLLLAWPANNYWDTNFKASQPGAMSFKYELRAFDRYDASAAAAAGLAASHPVQLFPAVECPAYKEGRLLSVSGAGANVIHVKPAEDGNGVILRMNNLLEKETEARISLPGRRVASAFATDALERNLEELPVDGDGEACRASFGARAFRTIRVVAES
ncbi:glycosyl hydrolase-related protein [Paenibacillus sp.]|uniref:glycoside hydrolase family 38 N-terminal domain-containing protein n=1 Tax=Paenibacillus sp. TaxID=58172 RepID=UPI00281246B7|nr:glycosyl hydrolase-related protein [Paenibacillus sp.]